MEGAQMVACGNKVHRPLLDETLYKEDLRVAREELNETPDSREYALKRLKQMLMYQNEFTPRTDDVYLLRFLRCRKFDCEQALKTIRDHYKFRNRYPAVFPSPSALERALKEGMFNFLPNRDHKGRAIYVVKFGLWNPDEVPYADFVAVGNLVAEYVLDNPVTQINGYIGIFDFGGFSMKHFGPFCLPKHIHLLTTLMQDRFPARFKIAYVVNNWNIVSTIWSIIKPVLKEKFRHRVKFIGHDMKRLHEHIEPSILSVEYGGPLETPDPFEMAQRVLGHEQYSNYNRMFGFQTSVRRQQSTEDV